MDLTENQVKQKLENFLNHLKEKLENEIRGKKAAIIDSVTLQKGAKETTFVRTWLEKQLIDYFNHNGVNIFIEGSKSNQKTKRSKTLFQNKYFNSQPAPDFVVEGQYCIAGEIKYGKLSVQRMATAVGQTQVYMAASKFEPDTKSYNYGCIIFFDTSMDPISLEHEKGFIKDLWEKHEIYLIML